jgi:hypothetical protein
MCLPVSGLIESSSANSSRPATKRFEMARHSASQGSFTEAMKVY